MNATKPTLTAGDDVHLNINLPYTAQILARFGTRAGVIQEIDETKQVAVVRFPKIDAKREAVEKFPLFGLQKITKDESQPAERTRS